VRKSVKRGLRSNERLFRSIFEYAQIGISVFSIDRHEHYSNRAMRQILGYSEEELSHLEKWDEITHPDDRVSCAERYAALLRGKREILKDADGKSTDMYGVSQDITEFKRLQPSTSLILKVRS